MTITQYEYFFDNQQRRFLEQIVRAFSGFSYQTGMRDGQPPQTLLVPCHFAQTNRLVANITRNGSENTLNAVPMISVFQTGLRGRKADLQNPFFVDSLQVFERNVQDNGQYGPNRGNAYSVDRLMPLPFEMEVQVDIWTSNLEQKYQLAEQILTVVYPQFQIQNSDNALDWSAVTICFVEDDIAFSSRSVPIGTGDEIDIMTIRLRVPIWLTPPAMIHKLNRIEQVVANVGQEVVDAYGEPLIGKLFKQVIVTPGDCAIAVDGNAITLLANKGCTTLPDGSLPSWANLLTSYGTFEEGVSTLRLMLTDDIEGPFVSGTLQMGSAVNTLVWTIDPDTLPANTQAPVNAVIDPMRTIPGGGLPTAIDGTRYLLVADVGPCAAWGALTAYTNDIIVYNGTLSAWQVAFHSRTTSAVQYVLNLYTNRQLRWTGREWLMSIDSMYGPGYWRLAL
jgi:hypothetical protein